MAGRPNREAGFPVWTGGSMDLGTQRRSRASLKEIRLAGVTGTLNEAEVELKKSWEQWLMWANLSEGKA